MSTAAGRVDIDWTPIRTSCNPLHFNHSTRSTIHFDIPNRHSHHNTDNSSTYKWATTSSVGTCWWDCYSIQRQNTQQQMQRDIIKCSRINVVLSCMHKRFKVCLMALYLQIVPLCKWLSMQSGECVYWNDIEQTKGRARNSKRHSLSWCDGPNSLTKKGTGHPRIRSKWALRCTEHRSMSRQSTSRHLQASALWGRISIWQQRLDQRWNSSHPEHLRRFRD